MAAEKAAKYQADLDKLRKESRRHSRRKQSKSALQPRANKNIEPKIACEKHLYRKCSRSQSEVVHNRDSDVMKFVRKYSTEHYENTIVE